MADTVSGVVEQSTKETRAGQYGEYIIQTFKLNNKNLNNIVKKDLPEVFDGEQVTVHFENVTNSKGTFIKPVKIIKGELTTEPVSPNRFTARRIDMDNVKVTDTAPWENKPVSKDVSMEVSGLLQAIITKHGLDGTTEGKLRTSLELKRKVAKDFE